MLLLNAQSICIFAVWQLGPSGVTQTPANGSSAQVEEAHVKTKPHPTTSTQSLLSRENPLKEKIKSQIQTELYQIQVTLFDVNHHNREKQSSFRVWMSIDDVWTIF